MRKFLSLFLVLFTLTFTFTLTCSAETLSDEILAQGKAEADLFLTLKQALGLDWIDEYNAYLGDPVTNPAPAWDTSVASLVSQGYLSSSFPTDFTIALTGQEVTISRTVSQAALREAMAIYLPAMTVSGDVVSLLVQRPAQWIAYETALNGKVDRDGSGNPDILPNSSLDFGSNSQINFVSNDGKILGVNSLFYKTQELDDRFINITGDTMTGILTATGFKVGSNNVWHQGNDGSGSGLDADLLDGQDSAFYRNASNINAGTLDSARLSGTYGISITGNAATATNATHANTADSANYATSAGNADTVDGKHASAFATASHGHGEYVQKAGDTMTGPLTVPALKVTTTIAGNQPPSAWPSGFVAGKVYDNGYPVTYGTVYSYKGTTTNSVVQLLQSWPGYDGGEAYLYIRSARDVGSDVFGSWRKIWSENNDGSGSGLDADLLDGKHESAFAPASHNHGQYVLKDGDTMTGALTAPEYRINDADTKLLEGANNSVCVQTNYGYTEIGPQNASYAHFTTDRPEFYFNKPVLAESKLQVYNTNTYLTGTEGKIAGNKVWHAGNDGSGSGLDADLLDGAHLSEILGGLTLKETIIYSTPGTHSLNKSLIDKPKIYRVIVKCWGGGGGGGGGNNIGNYVYHSEPYQNGTAGGTSSFGNVLYAYGGGGGQGASSYGGLTPGSGGSGSGGDKIVAGSAGAWGPDDYRPGGAGGQAGGTLDSPGGSGGLGVTGGDGGSGNSPGGGGAGGSTTVHNGAAGSGGGGGGFCQRTYSIEDFLNNFGSSIPIIVGGGGAGGQGRSGGKQGGNGAPGCVVIELWGL